PIVENAIIHAVEPLEEGGAIRLTVAAEADAVRVTVADSGGGMPEETVRRLLEGREHTEPEGHSTGIGVANVVRRLRLFYGQEDIIAIESRIGEGTAVTLSLPRPMSGDGAERTETAI